MNLKEIGIDGINFSIDTLDLREYFLLTRQDCLVVKVLRSPHAHALIEEIDVS